MRDENCIFCKIVSGEVPSHKVYEDEKFVVFMDINPRSPGHALVIPREHYRWVWDVPQVGNYFEVVRKIAQAQQKAFDTDFILSKIVGDEVEHAHIWVYPNKDVHGDKMAFEENGRKIKEYI